MEDEVNNIILYLTFLDIKLFSNKAPFNEQ